MSNYIPLFYMDMITYLCPKSEAALANLDKQNHIFFYQQMPLYLRQIFASIFTDFFLFIY